MSKKEAMIPASLEMNILYMRLMTGEELISIAEPPGKHIDIMIEDAENHPNTMMKKKIIKELKADKIKAAARADHMFELHYPMRIAYMPTQKGVPALILTPWISSTISNAQVFLIDKLNILTATVPDAELVAYYNQVVQKMILSIALRMTDANRLATLDPTSDLGKHVSELRKMIETEREESDDSEIERLLEKSKRKPEANTSGSDDLPVTVYANEKKTLH